MKYRKKPVTIEAFQYAGTLKDCKGNYCVPSWAVEAFESGTMYYKSILANIPPELIIHTLEGDHLVNIGDYIIRGIQGELYPCKPDIFEQTYERVEE